MSNSFSLFVWRSTACSSGYKLSAVAIECPGWMPCSMVVVLACKTTCRSITAEASVLSLYDKERLTGPKKNGQSTDWATLDSEVISQLDGIASNGGQIAIVSSSMVSPTTKKAELEFIAKYPNTKHITYDAIHRMVFQKQIAGLLELQWFLHMISVRRRQL